MIGFYLDSIKKEAGMKVEKREYPRVVKSLPFKISLQDYDVVTETKNICCNGAYCTVDRFIPYMTRFEVLMILPSIEKEEEYPSQQVRCEGVVVRVEEELSQKEKAYNIAIYFDRIKEEEKQKIRDFVARELEK